MLRRINHQARSPVTSTRSEKRRQYGLYNGNSSPRTPRTRRENASSQETGGPHDNTRRSSALIRKKGGRQHVRAIQAHGGKRKHQAVRTAGNETFRLVANEEQEGDVARLAKERRERSRWAPRVARLMIARMHTTGEVPTGKGRAYKNRSPRAPPTPVIGLPRIRNNLGERPKKYGKIRSE